MWRIPHAVISAGDDTALLQNVLDQLSDPQAFLQKVQALDESDCESFDTLSLKDGRIFEGLTAPSPGFPSAAAVWSLHDLTGQKQAEQAVAFSEERFRSIIELTFDAVSLLDESLNVIYSSPVVERRLGYTARDHVGHNMFELVHPDDLTDVRLVMQRTLKEPLVSVNKELRLLHKDGSWLWFDATATNLLSVPAGARHCHPFPRDYRPQTPRRKVAAAGYHG